MRYILSILLLISISAPAVAGDWIVVVQNMISNDVKTYDIDEASQVLRLPDRKCIIGEADMAGRGIICTIRTATGYQGMGTESVGGRECRLHIYKADAEWVWSIRMRKR